MMRLSVILLVLSGCATVGASGDRPEMVRLESGRFIAGSGSAETDAVHYPEANAAREQPARVVVVAHAFSIGRTEVTRGQFARFVAATGWTPDGPCSFQIDGPRSAGPRTGRMTGSIPVSRRPTGIRWSV